MRLRSSADVIYRSLSYDEPMKHGWIVAIATVATAITFGIPLFRADFHDVAASAGLTARNVYGGVANKDYILETTGNGVAILDYDADGRNDVLFANGTRFDSSGAPADNLSTLLHNEGSGHFKDVTAQSGLTQTGWGQGVCVGDYDNDGW